MLKNNDDELIMKVVVSCSPVGVGAHFSTDKSNRLLVAADILTRDSRRSTGVNDEMNDGC